MLRISVRVSLPTEEDVETIVSAQHTKQRKGESDQDHMPVVEAAGSISDEGT